MAIIEKINLKGSIISLEDLDDLINDYKESGYDVKNYSVDSTTEFSKFEANFEVNVRNFTEKHRQTQSEEPKTEEVSLPTGFSLTRETKSEKMQILIRPTTKEALRTKAKQLDVSLNELINNVLEAYLEENHE